MATEVQREVLCSVYGCVLRAVTTAVNCTGAVECLTVLLLDILSAVHDTARHELKANNNHIEWRSIMRRLTDAKSEAELYCGHDLSSLTKKLTQMKDEGL